MNTIKSHKIFTRIDKNEKPHLYHKDQVRTKSSLIKVQLL